MWVCGLRRALGGSHTRLAAKLFHRRCADATHRGHGGHPPLPLRDGPACPAGSYEPGRERLCRRPPRVTCSQACCRSASATSAPARGLPSSAVGRQACSRAPSLPAVPPRTATTSPAVARRKDPSLSKRTPCGASKLQTSAPDRS